MAVECYLEVVNNGTTTIYLCCSVHGRIHTVKYTSSDAAIAAEVKPVKVKHMIDHHA